MRSTNNNSVIVYNMYNYSSLLDLVIANNIYFVDEIYLQDSKGKRDHQVFDIVVIANTGNVIPIERRLYYKGDYDSMRNFKSID